MRATLNRRWKWLTATALLAAGLVIPAIAQIKPGISKLESGAIDVVAQPIRKFSRFADGAAATGKLTFTGGLVLTAPASANFGGWSGMIVDDRASQFLAISDSGVWLTGRLTYDGTTPAGITNARIGPLLARDGKPMRRSRDRDAEALALVRGTMDKGEVLIGFEQNTRIVRYDLTNNGISAPRGNLKLPASVQGLRANDGIEAVTIVRGGPLKGATVAIAQLSSDDAIGHNGWIWSGTGVRSFQLASSDGYDVTDIASLDDGTLFVLERRFRWTEGVRVRVRRVPAAELVAGATVVGEVLMQATQDSEIDNMEALAVSRNDRGGVVLTMLSDDNFNKILQRTLLLQFTVNATETAKARPPD